MTSVCFPGLSVRLSDMRRAREMAQIEADYYRLVVHGGGERKDTGTECFNYFRWFTLNQ